MNNKNLDDSPDKISELIWKSCAVKKNKKKEK